MNQNPNALAADLTTREDLNGKANSRILRRDTSEIERDENEPGEPEIEKKGPIVEDEVLVGQINGGQMNASSDPGRGSGGGGARRGSGARAAQLFMDARKVVMKFGRFIGPGMMVSVLLSPWQTNSDCF
jgi:metal iron transporter